MASGESAGDRRRAAVEGPGAGWASCRGRARVPREAADAGDGAGSEGEGSSLGGSPLPPPSASPPWSLLRKVLLGPVDRGPSASVGSPPFDTMVEAKASGVANGLYPEQPRRARGLGWSGAGSALRGAPGSWRMLRTRN